MIQLADQVFAVKTDANQLSVDEKVISQLQRIHPASVSEYNDGNGPIAWILVFPTTLMLMTRFLRHDISEKELFELTPPDTEYEAIYLCSALILPEFRGKGIAKNLSIQAVESIKKDHPIKFLFVWAFTKEGNALAEKIAALAHLPIKKL